MLSTLEKRKIEKPTEDLLGLIDKGERSDVYGNGVLFYIFTLLLRDKNINNSSIVDVLTYCAATRHDAEKNIFDKTLYEYTKSKKVLDFMNAARLKQSLISLMHIKRYLPKESKELDEAINVYEKKLGYKWDGYMQSPLTMVAKVACPKDMSKNKHQNIIWKRVSFLLNNPKITIDDADNYGKTLLMIVAERGYSSLFKEIIDHCKPNLKLVDNNKNNIMHFIAVSGNEVFFKEYALKFPELLKRENKDGLSPLDLIKNQTAKTSFFFEKEKNHNKTLSNLLTGRNDKNLLGKVTELLELHKADSNHLIDGDESIFQTFIVSMEEENYKTDIEIIKTLLKYGANPLVKNHEDEPLFASVFDNELSNLQKLELFANLCECCSKKDIKKVWKDKGSRKLIRKAIAKSSVNKQDIERCMSMLRGENRICDFMDVWNVDNFSEFFDFSKRKEMTLP